MKLITKLVSLITAAVMGLFSFVVAFGRQPRGERLERVKNSPNYSNGSFRNQEQADEPEEALPKSNSSVFNAIANLFTNKGEIRPTKPLPAIKTDLWQLDRREDVLLWMGHDAVFLQIDGIRILIDPTLVMGSPVSFIKTAFPATYTYTPDDIPDIDYLLISHEHWDHLDYHTFNKLRDRIGKVVCGLGVGEYFDYWKFPKDRLIELDWYENMTFGDGLTIHALPARHGTNRALASNKTLWVSFMLEAPSMTIFFSGDTGYGVHFPEIGRNFPNIDLAIMENGQYDEQWRTSHMLPGQLVRAIKDLNPARVFTVHHAKYDLANHSWRAPLENISAAAEREGFALLTPMMGEVVRLKDTGQTFSRWWET